MKDFTKAVYYTEMDSILGPLTIASTDNGICWIDFSSSGESLLSLERWAKRWVNTTKLVKAEESLHYVVKQLEEYFNKQRKSFDVPIDLYGTPFQKLVWKSLLEIPYGEVRSYKEIAMQINAPKSVRAIGGANHHNSVPIIVPCHRVIGSNGNLVGYAGGLDIKKSLLELEGYQLKA